MARIDFQKNDTYRNAYDGILRLTKHVSSVDELPEIGPSNGDIYSVGEDNSLYIYNGSWAPIGSGSSSSGGEFFTVHQTESARISGEYFSEIADLVDAVNDGGFKGGTLYLEEGGAKIFASISMAATLSSRAGGGAAFEYKGGQNTTTIAIKDDPAIIRFLSSISRAFNDATGGIIGFYSPGVEGGNICCACSERMAEGFNKCLVIFGTIEGYDGVMFMVCDEEGYPYRLELDSDNVITGVSVAHDLNPGEQDYDIVELPYSDVSGIVGSVIYYYNTQDK